MKNFRPVFGVRGRKNVPFFFADGSFAEKIFVLRNTLHKYIFKFIQLVRFDYEYAYIPDQFG
jgi:hypothetical protein